MGLCLRNSKRLDIYWKQAHILSVVGVQPHAAAQQQEHLRLLVQLRKYAQLVRDWSATLPTKAKQMPASQEQARQQCLKMHSSAQAFLSIVSATARYRDQTPSSPLPAGALEQLRKAQAFFLKVYPHIQRHQERAAAQRLALERWMLAQRDLERPNKNLLENDDDDDDNDDDDDDNDNDNDIDSDDGKKCLNKK